MDDYRDFVTFYIRSLPKLMNVERCTIFIMEIGSNKICSIFGTGLSERQIEPPLEGSIVGKVISSGISCIENDLKSHPGFHMHMDEQTGFISRNMLCAPIKSISGNSITGAVELLNKNHDDTFDEDSDIDILVELHQPIGWRFFSLEIYLEKTFGRKIDLVTKSALKEQIRDKILKQVNYV